MKITGIDTYTVFAYRTNFIFVEVLTDVGITGVGEGTLEYKEHALLGAIEDIKYALIGKDPRQIEKITSELYRDSYWRVCAVLQSAVSAVEMALWDIRGKELGVPVYELLGGKVRDNIRIYANGWFAGAGTPDEFASAARTAKERGVTALKWDPFGSAYLYLEGKELVKSMEIVEAVRSAVGNDVDLMIEGHGRFNIETAVRIAASLKPFNPMFFEEPTPPDSLDAIAQVRRRSQVPIAAGERQYAPVSFKEFLDKGCADFIQPDVSHCGGISAVRKIAAMAESSYVSVAPHNPSGPVANAATLQLAGGLSNFRILEIMVTDVSWRKKLTDEHIMFKEGAVAIPDRPGLGLTLDREECSKHPYQPVHLRHYKGTLTDIRPKAQEEYYFDGLGNM